MKHIQWKQGSKLTGSAEKVYGELEKIRKRDGNLTPQAVLNRAKTKSSPLHRHFTWDDSVAAEKYRLNEASYMLRSIEVVNTGDAKPQGRRVYEVTTISGGESEKPKSVYQDAEEAMADPEMRDEILGRAIRDALAYRRRYKHLQELAQVFAAMDEFLMTAEV